MIGLIVDRRLFSVAAELAKKGIVLPKVSKPVGNYVSVLRSGDTLYLCIRIVLR